MAIVCTSIGLFLLVSYWVWGVIGLTRHDLAVSSTAVNAAVRAYLFWFVVTVAMVVW